MSNLQCILDFSRKEYYALGQLGFLTRGLMMGMVLLVSLEPVSALRVDRLTMAPTDRRRLPDCLLLL